MRVFVTFAILAASASPALAIEFPLHADDLAAGERVHTWMHAAGGGPQTNAKDLLVRRHVADNNWSNLKPNKTDKGLNENYLIFGRPVYAMAPGKVVACWRNAPQNSGNSQRSEVGTGKIYLQGNHLWILQDDGNYALYAHAQTGDIAPALCPKPSEFLKGKARGGPEYDDPEAVVKYGATVTAGQLLFHAGNSGNSSEPHLHVHLVNAGNTTQVMKFDRGMTTPFPNGSAALNGPWTRLNGGALPTGSILIWPPHPIGNWTYNGIEAAAYQRVFDHFSDSRVMPNTITCKNNGASYDTTWEPSKGSWISHHGMTPSYFANRKTTYSGQGYTLASAYTCGTKTVAVWRKP